MGVPETDAINCEASSDCAWDRCQCNARFSVDLARHFSQNPDSLEVNHVDVDESQCVKSRSLTEQTKTHVNSDTAHLSSAGHNSGVHACCGAAPTWKPYNMDTHVCQNGVLSSL